MALQDGGIIKMHTIGKFTKILTIIFFLYAYTFNCSIAGNLKKSQLDNLSKVQGAISSHFQSMDNDLLKHYKDPICSMGFSYISQHYTWINRDLYHALVRYIINQNDIGSKDNPDRATFEKHIAAIPSKKIQNINTSECFTRVVRANTSESFEITGCSNFSKVNLTELIE